MIEKVNKYFTTFEKGLWLFSISAILLSYFIFELKAPLILFASLIAATFLILNAKGNPIGQILTVIFSLMYAFISYEQAYYGEMITYLFICTPIAIMSVISWLKNPSEEGKIEVKVNKLSQQETWFLCGLDLFILLTFYFLLQYFHTEELVLSTLSVVTSFTGLYLTMRRSVNFSLAYLCNDLIVLSLWLISAADNRKYFALVICFSIFIINDVYTYWNWLAIKKSQLQNK